MRMPMPGPLASGHQDINKQLPPFLYLWPHEEAFHQLLSFWSHQTLAALQCLRLTDALRTSWLSWLYHSISLINLFYYIYMSLWRTLGKMWSVDTLLWKCEHCIVSEKILILSVKRGFSVLESPKVGDWRLISSEVICSSDVETLCFNLQWSHISRNMGGSF